MQVSRQHAWVGLNDQGEVVVRDRNSANGTFAGGVRIQEKVLRQTDEFSLGTGRRNIFRLIMSFLEKFQIVSNVGAAETNTFRAQEILTGRPVLVHQIMNVQTSSIQPDLMSLVYTYLPGAGTSGTEHFLDSGEDDDCIYIVTSDVPECLDLRQWLQFIADSQGVAGSAQGEPGSTEGLKGQSDQPLPSSPPASVRPPSVASPPLTPETSGPGEFTQMFKGVGKGQVDQPHASSMPPARAPKASSPQPPSVKTGPGEFTLMFSAPQAIPEPPAASRPSPVVSKPSVPPSASPAQKQPGEFTAHFPAPAQAPSQAEPPLSGPSQAPTMPSAGSGSRGHTHEPPAFPASQSDSRSPGEFTQLFKGSGDPARGARPPVIGSPSQPSVPLSSSSKKGPGELTLMMQGYKPPTATPAAPVLEAPKPSSPPPTAEPGKKGPGEFTMLFHKPPQPVAPVPPAAPPPPVVQAAPPPPKAHQPGEYTSIFEAPRLPPTPPQAAPQAGPPAGYGYPAVGAPASSASTGGAASDLPPSRDATSTAISATAASCLCHGSAGRAAGATGGHPTPAANSSRRDEETDDILGAPPASGMPFPECCGVGLSLCP